MRRTTKTRGLLAVTAPGAALLWQSCGGLHRSAAPGIVVGLAAFSVVVIVGQAIRAAYRERLVVGLLSRWLGGRSERLERALREGTWLREPFLQDPRSRAELDRRIPCGVVPPGLALARAQVHAEDRVIVGTISVFAPQPVNIDTQGLDVESAPITGKALVEGPVAHQYIVIGRGETERILALAFDSVYVYSWDGCPSFFIVRDHHGIPIITSHESEADMWRQVKFEFGISSGFIEEHRE